MDGNLYLDEEQVATTKEKTVLQELEEGTTKLNNFKSNLRDDSDSNNININSGGGGGIRTGSGTGVKSGNSVIGIKVSTEGGVGSAIDENASVSKQTIQALRYLFKAGRYVIISAELFYILSLIPSSSLLFKFTLLLSIFLLKIFYFCYFMVRKI